MDKPRGTIAFDRREPSQNCLPGHAFPRLGHEGSVLVVALLILLALSLLGVAGIMTSTTEFQIAGNQYRGNQALYAADGGGQAVLRTLVTMGPGGANILMTSGLPAVNWTDVPGSNPVLANRDRYRIVDQTGALKAPSVDADDFAGVSKGAPLAEVSDVSNARAKFSVGRVEGNIPDLNVSRQVEFVVSFPFKAESY